jgi:hypothetical protein
LKKTNPGVILLQNLVRIDGVSGYDADTDGVTEWLVELRPEAK